MAKSENKTKPTDVSVDAFIAGVAEPRQGEARKLLAIMRDITGEEPVMWGPSMIGFGSYHYTYASGREGDMLKIGFSPRKPALVLYGLVHYEENEVNSELLGSLGPHERGKGCLYIKNLHAVDEATLRQMITNAYHHTTTT